MKNKVSPFMTEKARQLIKSQGLTTRQVAERFNVDRRELGEAVFGKSDNSTEPK